MLIKPWVPTRNQICTLGKYEYSVPRLFELVKDFPVMEIPIEHLCIWHEYERLSMRDMIMHIRAINDADLSYPIILDEDGILMDGHHRIMKVLLLGLPSIKAVRFDENPYPCKIVE